MVTHHDVISSDVVVIFTARLCVSTVFAGALCPSVHLSFHLSVTLVYCIQMAEDIVKPLSQPGSPIILVF